MKTHVLLFGALLTSALACETHDSLLTVLHSRARALAALGANKTTSQSPTRSTAPSSATPAPKPDGKKSEPRPSRRPEYLFL